MLLVRLQQSQVWLCQAHLYSHAHMDTTSNLRRRVCWTCRWLTCSCWPVHLISSPRQWCLRLVSLNAGNRDRMVCSSHCLWCILKMLMCGGSCLWCILKMLICRGSRGLLPRASAIAPAKVMLKLSESDLSMFGLVWQCYLVCSWQCKDIQTGLPDWFAWTTHGQGTLQIWWYKQFCGERTSESTDLTCCKAVLQISFIQHLSSSAEAPSLACLVLSFLDTKDKRKGSSAAVLGRPFVWSSGCEAEQMHKHSADLEVASLEQGLRLVWGQLSIILACSAFQQSLHVTAVVEPQASRNLHSVLPGHTVVSMIGSDWHQLVTCTTYCKATLATKPCGCITWEKFNIMLWAFVLIICSLQPGTMLQYIDTCANVHWPFAIYSYGWGIMSGFKSKHVVLCVCKHL